MTPAEKAENALNRRIERLQARLREAESESARTFLVQSLVVTIGLGEALTGYVKAVGEFAQRRHGDLKGTHEALTARHAELLESGNALLAQWKANPADRELRKQIDRTQQDMENVQKTLRRGANALQRDVAPAIAQIDQLAESIRRFSDAEEIEALKRPLRMLIGQVRELYLAHPGLPAMDLIDAESWETSAESEIDQAADLYDAYARAAHQAILTIEVMTLAVSATPPATANEAADRANEAAAARIKGIAARLAAD